MSTSTLPLPSVASTGSANTLRIFWVETRYEFIRMMRTRAFSLSVIGFPVMFYTLFGLLMNQSHGDPAQSAARYLLGGYAVFGAVGSALFGVGVGLSAELNAGWLELKRASPMPPLAYLLAKCCTAMAFGVMIVCLLCGLGVAFGHVSLTGLQFAKMIALTLANAIPFACIGLLVALLVPANSAPGVANMLYLPMSFLGGLWLPVHQLPKFLQALAPALPTFHAGQLMLEAMGFPAIGRPVGHVLYLAGFSLCLLGVASLIFHRREQNS